MGASEVEAFLTCLALDWNVAESTQIKVSVGQVSIPAQSSAAFDSLPA
jgi:hypothetical protein